MQIGQVISRTFRVTKERFALLIGLLAVFFVLQIGLSLALVLGVGATAVSGVALGDANALGAGMIAMLFLFYLVYFMVAFAQMAAMTAAASPLQRMDFGSAFNAGLRSAPTLLGVFILMMIGYLIFALVFGIFAAILSVAGSAGAVVAVLLILPAAIYLLCRLSMVNAVAAVDRIGNPVAVIARSWAMTKGHVLPIFAVFLIFGLGSALALVLVLAPFITSLSGNAIPGLGSIAFVFVGLLIASVAISMLFAALFAVIHSEISGNSAEQMDEVFG